MYLCVCIQCIRVGEYKHIGFVAAAVTFFISKEKYEVYEKYTKVIS